MYIDKCDFDMENNITKLALTYETRGQVFVNNTFSDKIVHSRIAVEFTQFFVIAFSPQRRQVRRVKILTTFTFRYVVIRPHFFVFIPQ